MFLYTSEFTSGYIINEHKLASTCGIHIYPNHNTPTTMFQRWGGMLWIFSSFGLHSFLLPSQIHFGLICPHLFPELWALLGHPVFAAN